jgi:hypothetical protein
MATPWTEALEDACGFARKLSSELDVARRCTTGLFFAQRFYYPGDYKSYWTNQTTFLLTSYYNFGSADGGEPGDRHPAAIDPGGIHLSLHRQTRRLTAQMKPGRLLL